MPSKRAAAPSYIRSQNAMTAFQERDSRDGSMFNRFRATNELLKDRLDRLQ
jgi:hypothetical protein